MRKRPSLAAAASRLESSVLQKTANTATRNSANTEERKSADTASRDSVNAETRETVKLSFAIPIDTHEELKVLAARRRQKIGALVEGLIDAELARQK